MKPVRTSGADEGLVNEGMRGTNWAPAKGEGARNEYEEEVSPAFGDGPDPHGILHLGSRALCSARQVPASLPMATATLPS